MIFLFLSFQIIDTQVHSLLYPGKWMVTISLLIYPRGSFTIDDWMFVRSTFFRSKPDNHWSDKYSVTGCHKTYLNEFSVGRTFNGGQKYSVATGTVQINNTSGTNKTYSYIVGNTQASGTVAGAGLTRVGGSWSENAIMLLL
jgi:hypothetical protein